MGRSGRSLWPREGQTRAHLSGNTDILSCKWAWAFSSAVWRVCPASVPRLWHRALQRFGATVAVGVTIFVLFIVTIIACFTCSCCCLYKMCCRPRPVVTTTTSTTVVHAPYPQPPSVPPTYPGPSYQGYHPIAPQPGMAPAPYPTQYPPPYPAQPTGPPAYHETLAGGAATPYPPSQPPYNPAYMDPPKAAY
ncbi:protein shisa-5 isoform X4 [Artibeus jamaicensis]|uniref:protein shisa-5 isoform X4 n=1 Tax=Artibeus jamaicensis TaxID=9417 RepID=UPI00235AD4C9|nr:protein shisa-5 isoform X4 [Artibeus jamaicensis]